MISKKRKWSEKYVQYGFTCATENDGTQYPQCMLCNVNLSNSSLAPDKPREHFAKVHGLGKYKDTALNQFKQKRAQFATNATTACYGFVPVDKPILIASYEVAYLNAKQGNRISLMRHLSIQLHCNWPRFCWENKQKASFLC